MAESQAGAAFLRPPMMAQYFKDNAEQVTQNPAAPAQPEQPQNVQPDPMTVTVPPPPRRGSPILPQPTQTAAPQQPPVAPPSQVDTPQEQTLAPTAPAEPAVDPIWQQQLDAERRAFAQREQQWGEVFQQQNQQLAELQKAQMELAQYKQREALAQKFSNDDAFAGLETVDPKDARRIIQMAADALYPQLADAHAQLEAERTQMTQQMAQTRDYAQKQAQAAQAVRLRDQLLGAHPDFFQLYNNSAVFRNFLATPEGKSSYTREQMAMAEYNMGNAAYLIDLIDKFKGTAPKAQDIQSVAPVQVATNAPVASQPAQPTLTLADLNRMMHTGRISQDVYRQELDKLRAAQPQPV